MAHLESLVILDPNPRSRAALVFGFERAGYSVYATGETGDALAMAQTRVPQLLVAAPSGEASGTLDVIGRLRDEAKTHELPIVVLGEPSAREQALRAGADEFIARPAFIRDVLTLAKLAVAVRQDGDDSGVVGLLEDYGLFFLTRALAVAGRSCVVELERGRRRGEVHFSKGEVVSARAGRMNGVPAFMQLLLWGQASMHLRFESPTGERKINAPIDELLAAAARFGREFEALAARIGGPEAVYRQSPTRAAEVRTKIPAEVLGLVRLFDGKRPLVDVVEDSPFKPFDTVKITFRLRELQAIDRVDEARLESPLTAQLAVRDWLLGSAIDEPRSTVTEAGRRAAEAYAEAAAQRATERAPAEDLFGETERTPRIDRETVAVPPLPPPVSPPMSPPASPALPKPASAAAPVVDPKRGPHTKKKNKPQAKRDTAPLLRTNTPSSKPPSPSLPPAKGAAAPPVGKGGAPGKLPAHAAAGAPHKEPLFNDVEEDFFAREQEYVAQPSADNFDDLDTGPKRKIPPKRRWFLFGKDSPGDAKKR